MSLQTWQAGIRPATPNVKISPKAFHSRALEFDVDQKTVEHDARGVSATTTVDVCFVPKADISRISRSRRRRGQATMEGPSDRGLGRS